MEEGVRVNEKVETPLPGSGRKTHKTKEVNGNFRGSEGSQNLENKEIDDSSAFSSRI